jgi:class 3 adenylate cyclase
MGWPVLCCAVQFIYDIWGDAVNLASRMETHGVAGYVQVSEDTYRLLRQSKRGRSVALPQSLRHGAWTKVSGV